jgi:hypothetical protein
MNQTIITSHSARNPGAALRFSLFIKSDRLLAEKVWNAILELARLYNK